MMYAKSLIRDLGEIEKNNYIEIMIGIGILCGLYIISRYNFLLFHSLAEFFSIFISLTIFLLVWNSRHSLKNNYLLITGIAYLFIGGIDILHCLLYKGMGILPGNTANMPAQLWIGARYMEGLTFLIAPFFLNRKLDIKSVLLTYVTAFYLLLTAIFIWKVFPVCFIEGAGLTLFKKMSEYIISIILIAGVFLLYKKRNYFINQIFQWLFLSLICAVTAELAFTFYISVYGLSNMVGHFFKIVSLYFIYKAIVETCIKRPYDLLLYNLKENHEKLKDQRDRLQAYLDSAGVILTVIDSDQKVAMINKKGCRILGYMEQEVIGKNWFEHFIPERTRKSLKDTFKAFISGEIKDLPEGYEGIVLTRSGKERVIKWHFSIISEKSGPPAAVLFSGEDITKRKQEQEALKESEVRLTQIANVINDAFFVLDISSFKALYVSPGYERIWGRPLEGLYDNPLDWIEPIQSKDKARVKRAFFEVIKNKGYDEKFQIVHSDGSVRWIHKRGFLILDDEGNKYRIASIAQDITEYKRTESLQNTAKDEEIVLSEIQHRTKNGL